MISSGVLVDDLAAFLADIDGALDDSGPGMVGAGAAAISSPTPRFWVSRVGGGDGGGGVGDEGHRAASGPPVTGEPRAQQAIHPSGSQRRCAAVTSIASPSQTVTCRPLKPAKQQGFSFGVTV